MRHPLIRKLEASPVLPSVKEEACLPLQPPPGRGGVSAGGDLLTIPHGLPPCIMPASLPWCIWIWWPAFHPRGGRGLASPARADGIISTRPHLIRRGRELGLLTVLRVFAIDSKAVGNLTREAAAAGPDGRTLLKSFPERCPGSLHACPGSCPFRSLRGPDGRQNRSHGGAQRRRPVRFHLRSRSLGELTHEEAAFMAVHPCTALAVLSGSIACVLLVRPFYYVQIGPLGFALPAA